MTGLRTTTRTVRNPSSRPLRVERGGKGGGERKGKHQSNGQVLRTGVWRRSAGPRLHTREKEKRKREKKARAKDRPKADDHPVYTYDPLRSYGAKSTPR